MYKSQAQFQSSFLDNFAYREIIDRYSDNILVKLNNTERVHYAFQNKLSPVQFMVQRQEQKLLQAQL